MLDLGISLNTTEILVSGRILRTMLNDHFFSSFNLIRSNIFMLGCRKVLQKTPILQIDM